MKLEFKRALITSLNLSTDADNRIKGGEGIACQLELGHNVVWSKKYPDRMRLILAYKLNMVDRPWKVEMVGRGYFTVSPVSELTKQSIIPESIRRLFDFMKGALSAVVGPTPQCLINIPDIDPYIITSAESSHDTDAIEDVLRQTAKTYKALGPLLKEVGALMKDHVPESKQLELMATIANASDSISEATAAVQKAMQFKSSGKKSRKQTQRRRRDQSDP